MNLVSELHLPKLLTREHHRIHLVGVAGSGMSGIAALLLELELAGRVRQLDGKQFVRARAG